jgi:5-methylcytosine-specific restriction endonuclease McrA
MPQALARACRVLGCPGGDACTHGRIQAAQAVDRERGSSAARGYSSRWRAFRDWYMSELFRTAVPRAGLCGARLPGAAVTDDSVCARTDLLVLGTVLDHIVPVTGPDDARFFAKLELQLLCESCHNAKRQRERKII